MSSNLKTRILALLLLAWANVVYAQGPGGMSGSMSQQVANQVSRTISSSISKNLTDRILMPQLKIRNQSGKVKDFSITADFRFFTLLHDDNTVRVWDSRQGVQRPIISPIKHNITKVVSISALNIALLGTDDGDIGVYDVYTGKRVQQLKSINEEVVSLSVSKDESLLAVAYENGEIIIWDLKKRAVIKSIKTPYDDDIKFVKLEANGLTFIATGEDGFVDRWSIDKSEKIVSLPKHSGDILSLWVSDVYGSVASFDEDNLLQLSDINNSNKLKKEIDIDPLTIALSDDLAQLAVATEEGGIKIFDANTMQLLKEITLRKDFFYLHFINRGKLLIAADKEGILHLFSVSSGKEILKLISTETGWTIVDDRGRFDSSEKGMTNISWEVEEYEMALDDFSSSYYEPGLLASHLGDQKFLNKDPSVVQQGIKLPPDVVIVIPEGDRSSAEPIIVSVQAQGLGGGVKDIRLYHNGKVVMPGAVVNKQEETIERLMKKTVDFKIRPTVGKNYFKVIATNKMGIEGHSDEIVVDFSGKTQKTTLHVLTIGINQYKDSRLNLDYSVADAAAIANIFKQNKSAVYDDMVPHELRDKEATKDAILRQLNSISQFPQNDIMVIYLAGHGIAVDGEWYYLPHETMLKNNQNYYTQVGISAKEIQKILIDSNVQRVMIMVDACYAGAGLDSFRKMQNTQRHFSRGLSKSVGVVVLAATRKDQQAAELTDLGHGLFTYVVSEGMNGKADLKPKNSIISAHEVAEFSTETIPAYAKKYLGASQEPTAFTMGSNFTLLKQK